ncbi:sulfurtransferase [Candidatus Pantoea deserta]|uniref:Sulfurtransferase n=1 Tax=Candidatus Pantoea deserta TaxID=1869313 RepID=A0A3N4NCI5_9GAMM|nr:rhodanese-like domain-containing protein [Pantoea deserta]RPD94014.1 sulfurtransferase [Pantoea deserta]
MAVTFPSGPLVSAAWLAQHHAHVIILDCSVARAVDGSGQTVFSSGRDLFTQQHIPGAQFADLFDGFSDPDGDFLFTAPSAQRLSSALHNVGVNQQSLIVAYDRLNGAYAARIWYLLTALYGWSNVRVLDGGLAAWQRLPQPLESGAARPVARGTVRLGAARPALVSTERVAEERQRPLVCALRYESFQQAHIPGSISLPYPALLNEDGLVDTHRVAAALHTARISPPEQLLLYCGGGINAAGLALALVAAGYPLDALLLYDDSLSGWLSDASRPVASGAGR